MIADTFVEIGDMMGQTIWTVCIAVVVVKWFRYRK